MQELRTEPRQRRSQQSIDAILDAAERLIHDDGQVSFTAAELAAGADMSIGRVYYWFPDIPSVVNALVERTMQRMVEVFGAALSSETNTSTPLLIQRVVGALCDHIDGNPATVGNGVMVALAAKDADQVQRLYDIALAQGGTDEGAPGDRGGGFYAGYFRDLDGNKLNAFVMAAPA